MYGIRRVTVISFFAIGCNGGGKPLLGLDLASCTQGQRSLSQSPGEEKKRYFSLCQNQKCKWNKDVRKWQKMKKPFLCQTRETFPSRIPRAPFCAEEEERGRIPFIVSFHSTLLPLFFVSHFHLPPSKVETLTLLLPPPPLPPPSSAAKKKEEEASGREGDSSWRRRRLSPGWIHCCDVAMREAREGGCPPPPPPTLPSDDDRSLLRLLPFPLPRSLYLLASASPRLR